MGSHRDRTADTWGRTESAPLRTYGQRDSAQQEPGGDDLPAHERIIAPFGKAGVQ